MAVLGNLRSLAQAVDPAVLVARGLLPLPPPVNLVPPHRVMSCLL